MREAVWICVITALIGLMKNDSWELLRRSCEEHAPHTLRMLPACCSICLRRHSRLIKWAVSVVVHYI